jgi:hypothetical protein
MKSVKKVIRLKLEAVQGNNLILLGLVSADPDYKLSLSLNKKFMISLKSISPLKIPDDSGSELLFSRFSDTSASPDLIFNLISNRSGKNFLIKNLKNIDFVFQIHDTENENSIDKITSWLREIESLNAIFNIDINTFKDKNLHYLTL